MLSITPIDFKMNSIFKRSLFVSFKNFLGGKSKEPNLKFISNVNHRNQQVHVIWHDADSVNDKIIPTIEKGEGIDNY